MNAGTLCSVKGTTRVGLCYRLAPDGEFWWPGYERQPLAESVTWAIPEDLRAEQVIGPVQKSFNHSSPPWAIEAVGIMGFDDLGQMTGEYSRMRHPRLVGPGDKLTCHSFLVNEGGPSLRETVKRLLADSPKPRFTLWPEEEPRLWPRLTDVDVQAAIVDAQLQQARERIAASDRATRQALKRLRGYAIDWGKPGGDETVYAMLGHLAPKAVLGDGYEVQRCRAGYSLVREKFLWRKAEPLLPWEHSPGEAAAIARNHDHIVGGGDGKAKLTLVPKEKAKPRWPRYEVTPTGYTLLRERFWPFSYPVDKSPDLWTPAPAKAEPWDFYRALADEAHAQATATLEELEGLKIMPIEGLKIRPIKGGTPTTFMPIGSRLLNWCFDRIADASRWWHGKGGTTAKDHLPAPSRRRFYRWDAKR